MALIAFGIGFGLLIGFGLFMLLIYPAIKERRQEKADHHNEL
jgi:hypothetical protein